MQVKKVSQRIYLRHAPVLLLAPACGFMAYSWNPRAGNELGRLVGEAKKLPRAELRRRYEDGFMTALEPHPKEVMLRNHV